MGPNNPTNSLRARNKANSFHFPLVAQVLHCAMVGQPDIVY